MTRHLTRLDLTGPHARNRVRSFVAVAVTTLVLSAVALAARAAETAPETAVEQTAPVLRRAILSMLAVVTTAIVGVAVGLGLGAFGLVARQIFRQRAVMTDRILCSRPGLSFAAGLAITFAGLALLALFQQSQALSLLVLLLYFGGLATFAGTAAVQLAARAIEPPPTPDESPSAGAAIRGGLVLILMNAVPFLGSLLLLAILLAGVGASLLSYFASLFAKVGGAAAAVASDARTVANPDAEIPRRDDG